MAVLPEIFTKVSMLNFVGSIWAVRVSIISFREGFQITNSFFFNFPSYGVRDLNQALHEMVDSEARRHTANSKCDDYVLQSININHQ